MGKLIFIQTTVNKKYKNGIEFENIFKRKLSLSPFMFRLIGNQGYSELTSLKICILWFPFILSVLK